MRQEVVCKRQGRPAAVKYWRRLKAAYTCEQLG